MALLVVVVCPRYPPAQPCRWCFVALAPVAYASDKRGKMEAQPALERRYVLLMSRRRSPPSFPSRQTERDEEVSGA